MKRNLLLLLFLGFSPFLAMDLFSGKMQSSVVVENFKKKFLNKIERLESQADEFYTRSKKVQVVNYTERMEELNKVKIEYRKIQFFVVHYYPDIADEINNKLYSDFPESKLECVNNAREIRALVRRIRAFTHIIQVTEGEILEFNELEIAYYKNFEINNSSAQANKYF